MRKVSNRTKQCKHRKNLFNFLHFLCLFGPLLFFIPYGYVTGETAEKIGMSFAVIVSIILLIVSIICSTVTRAGLHKTMMWILILGVLICLQNVKTFIVIMCLTSIVDELLFVRLRDHYKAALISNKEIDRRM